MTAALPSLVVAAVVLAAAGSRRWFIAPRRVLTDDREERPGRWRLKRRSAHPDDDDIAAWCEQVARIVRAGSSLAVALAQTATDVAVGGAAFDQAVRALRR